MKFKEFRELEKLLVTEGQINPIFKGNSAIVAIDKSILTGRKDKAQITAALMDVYNELLPKLDGVLSKLDTLMKGASRTYKNVKYTSGLKPFTSIVDKAIDRKKGFSQLNDLVRCAVLFNSPEDADDFVKRFTRKYSNLVAGLESKEKGGDKTYGYYGSHHLDLNIDGIIVEVQIMSKKMWNYKHAAHKIYTASRSNPDGPSKADIHLSKKIFSMANAPSYVREEFSEFENVLITEEELIDLSDFPEAVDL